MYVRRYDRFRMSWAVVAALVMLCALGCGHREGSQQTPGTPRGRGGIEGMLGEYVVVVDQLRAVLGLDRVPGTDDFRGMVERAGARIGNASRDGSGGVDVVDSLIQLIYGQWGLTFDPKQDSLPGVLPHMIVARRSGSCLGVSLLMLLLAEQSDLPLHGVVLPGHFFVRYDDGDIRRNIEPNLRGYAHSDSYYRARYLGGDDSWYDMRNLDEKQTIGILWYNSANTLQAEGRHKAAVRFYREAVARVPEYGEAWGNLAISLAALGRDSRAREAFDSAFLYRPCLTNLAENRGSFELKRERYAPARESFLQGLACDPENGSLMYCMALAMYRLGVLDSAKLYLDAARAVAYSHPGDADLLRRIQRKLAQSGGASPRAGSVSTGEL